MPRSHYETHHNGVRPFFVEVDGKAVSVARNMNTYKLVDGKFVDISHPPKHLFTKVADEIFIGKKSPKGGYDGLKAAVKERLAEHKRKTRKLKLKMIAKAQR